MRFCAWGEWQPDHTTSQGLLLPWMTRLQTMQLEGPHPATLKEGSPAFEGLRRLVLNKTLQKDLAKARGKLELEGGTSVCESKNALDRLYCRKEIYYPLFTYKLYAVLSTMRFNTLRLAEMAGERRVQRVIEVQRKYYTRTSRMTFKAPVEHLWRDQITQAVLDARQEHHEFPPDEVDLQEMIDAEAAFDEGEPHDIDGGGSEASIISSDRDDFKDPQRNFDCIYSK